MEGSATRRTSTCRSKLIERACRPRPEPRPRLRLCTFSLALSSQRTVSLRRGPKSNDSAVENCLLGGEATRSNLREALLVPQSTAWRRLRFCLDGPDPRPGLPRKTTCWSAVPFDTAGSSHRLVPFVSIIANFGKKIRKSPSLQSQFPF